MSHDFELVYLFFVEVNMERDKFMSPTEAREFGIIDMILDHPPKFTADTDTVSYTHLTLPTIYSV